MSTSISNGCQACHVIIIIRGHFSTIIMIITLVHDCYIIVNNNNDDVDEYTQDHKCSYKTLILR